MTWPRWIWLRALGAIFFSAFYALAFQIHGLIGRHGILPVQEYLTQVSVAGAKRFWYVPSVLWLNASDHALTFVVLAGLASSLLLVMNVWPRLQIAICTVLFLSCVTTLQDFSSYQSDGMLLEAGVISWFFAPRGVRPGLASRDPPSWASLFMLRWEWFRIYFESGLVKLMSGDPHWRNLTAMDEYYQNGPLPAWPGWYIQHLPHWYHAFTSLFTLVVELVIVWALFAPRKIRIACAVVCTGLQIGIIATANYAFLNHLVLMLGVLLVDNRAIVWARRVVLRRSAAEPKDPLVAEEGSSVGNGAPRFARGDISLAVLGWLFYATWWAFISPGSRSLFAAPERALEPFRFANAYGLFANMTDQRYEIEFQGTADSGKTWIAYPYRYKPQDIMERPGIYAPYQPRFEWNLWFASLEPWRANTWVVNVQARLMQSSPDVLRLFRRDPFAGKRPTAVRSVLWQYWFTDWNTHRQTGAWWRRTELGLFAGTVSRDSTGQLVLQEAP